MSAPSSSPSSPTSTGVQAACTGPRRPTTRISRIPEPTNASIAASVVSVGLELLAGQREHAGDVERDVAVPDHDRALAREVERELLEVGVAVVPGDELGGGEGAGEILAGNPQPPVGLRADRVDHGVVEAGELLVGDVPADLDVAEEAEARLLRGLLERPRDGLDLRVIGRDAEADEPPRRRQPLDQVDLDLEVAREQRGGGVEARPAPSRRPRRGGWRPGSPERCYGT